jgi:hypothetical protein
VSAAAGRDAVADVHPDDGPAGAVEQDAGSHRPGTVRTVVAAGLALLFLAAAVVLTRQGIVTDTWPGFLPDAESTSITRYEGPWLTAGAVALLGAGLSTMTATRGLRFRRGGR